MIAFLDRAIFGHRHVVLVVLMAITVAMAWGASQLRIDAGFEKQLPSGHPYMETFLEYQSEFGGANRVLIALRATEGDIFTPEFFETLAAVTDETFFVPGVNRARVTSIFTPNVRFIEIVEDGFAGGNVIPAEFEATPEWLAIVRENILKSGQVGRLVAEDFTAAIVSAELLERDPVTGARLDYIDVANALETRIREQYRTDAVDIHIIGFAKVVGDVAEGAFGVLVFFAIAVAITIGCVYLYCTSWQLTLAASACSLVAVVWQLGALTYLGFGIDPMSILVPFLVFAIGVSHAVQVINAVNTRYFLGETGLEAARKGFRFVATPGVIALVSDTVGFLTLMLIDIPMIQELAITASVGVAAIIITNIVLLPVLLSFLRFKPDYTAMLQNRAEQRMPIWRAVARTARPVPATILVVTAAGLFALGTWQSQNLVIGDQSAGVPELRPDSRYNQDTAIIVDRFAIGVDVITVIVEAPADGCIDYDVVRQIDAFDWHMRNLDGVQSTLSLPSVMKIVNAGWNEGSLNWRVLSPNPFVLVRSVTPIETATGLLNADCSVMPVMIFTEDHRAETIERIVAAVKAYQADHPSDRVTFRLATGNVGVMAATNEAVAAAQLPMLAWVYAAIILLCLAMFRSVRGTICTVLPLTLVSVLCYALMAMLGIGLKVSTLPVAALGVGIGVDYGIYIFSRLKVYLRDGMAPEQAYIQTLRETGSAVLFTGVTLAIGVSTWAFSALQFQADMGVLLTFMFLVNMLGTVLLLPALACLFGRIRPWHAPGMPQRTPSW